MSAGVSTCPNSRVAHRITSAHCSSTAFDASCRSCSSRFLSHSSLLLGVPANDELLAAAGTEPLFSFSASEPPSMASDTLAGSVWSFSSAGDTRAFLLGPADAAAESVEDLFLVAIEYANEQKQQKVDGEKRENQQLKQIQVGLDASRGQGLGQLLYATS